jgi:hypothetical protein
MLKRKGALYCVMEREREREREREYGKKNRTHG